MHIRTDFYEERRDGRGSGRPRDGRGGGPGGDRARGGPRRDRAPGEHGGWLHGERTYHDRPRSGEDRQPPRSGRSGEGRGDENRRQGRKRPDRGALGAVEGQSSAGRQGSSGRPGANQELSRLSFDERMAYYKQKYEAEPQPAEGGWTRRGDDAQGRRPARKRPDRGAPGAVGGQSPSGGQRASGGGGKNPEGRGQGPAGKSGEGRKGRNRNAGGQSSRGRRGQGQSPSGRPDQRQAQTPKPGLLSRIFGGIFKGKTPKN
jgi:hypothetical protein